MWDLWGWLEITPLKTFFSFMTFRYLSIPIKVVTQKRGNFDGLPPKMWLFNTSLRCVCTCTVLSGCLRFLDLSFMSSRVHLNYLCKNYILSYLSGSEVLNILFLYSSIKKHFYYLLITKYMNKWIIQYLYAKLPASFKFLVIKSFSIAPR